MLKTKVEPIMKYIILNINKGVISARFILFTSFISFIKKLTK